MTEQDNFVFKAADAQFTRDRDDRVVLIYDGKTWGVGSMAMAFPP